MTPIRSIRAARKGIERLSSRRRFLRDAAWAAGGLAAGSVFGQGVLDPILEPVAGPISDALYGAPDPVPHLRENLGLEEFDRLASTEQKIALESLQLTGIVPQSDRCSTIEERDGEMWVTEQGERAGAILWGRPMIGRMADRPDRTFGLWRAECIRTAGLRSAPTFELVRAIANGRPHRYTALVVPGRQIKVVSADLPAIEPRTPRSTAQTTHPGIG